MRDPMDDLREAIAPVHPDPGFAAGLRRRIERALRGQTGGTMTTAITTSRYRALTPYIAVVDAPRALDWYEDVFEARRGGDFVVDPDGRVGHAELEIGDAVLMLGEDRRPDPPAPGSGRSSIFIQVTDPDATVARAVAAGAGLERPVADEPYGRMGVVVDPFGHRWIVFQQPAAAAEPAPRHGDVGYVTIGTPDSERAKAFYGAVLGWRFGPGSVEQGWQVEGVRPMAGLAGGADRPSVELCFAVDDIESALQRVRAAGGRTEEPAAQPYGRLANCVDDQGARFQLWQPEGRRRKP